MEKILYIVATPIGNLRDLTLRALDVLKSVDVVVCEDTRITKRLLDRYEISVKTLSLHQHSSDGKTRRVLQSNKTIAYVTDAGTPGISDPGNKIVEIAVEMGIKVEPIPGASAIVSALSVSGLPTDKFTFMGFMPHKGRTKIMNQIKDSKITIGFYDSPHRILRTLNELKDYIELDRKVVVFRELTKKFESIYRGNIEEVIEMVEPKQKGEFVVVVY